MIRWKGSLRRLKQNKIFSLLGLAAKGRNLVSGEFQTMEAIRSQSAYLILVALDASDNTKKLFHDKSSYCEIPVYDYGTKDDLGRAIGKDLRSSLGVCEEGLANAIIKQLEIEQNAAGGRNGGKNGEN